MKIKVRVKVGKDITIMYFNNTLELIKAQMSGLTVLEVLR